MEVGIMSNFFLLTTIASFFASGYFLVKLGIGFVDQGARRTHFFGKRLMIAVTIFLVSFVAFSVSSDNAKKRAQHNEIVLQETQQKAAAEKEAQQKAAAEKIRQTAAEQEKTTTQSSPEGKIKAQIRSYVREYDGTSVDSITVNPNMGTDKDDDYIALVRLTWNVRNDGELSKEMLDMYSSDIAIKMYKDLPEVQELAVFWTVPYLNGSAKISFERVESGMKYTDKMFDNNFNKK